MTKATRARYTLEFKLEAVRLVKGGQSMAATAKILGIAEQTLHNWIRADKDGRLMGWHEASEPRADGERWRRKSEHGDEWKLCPVSGPEGRAGQEQRA